MTIRWFLHVILSVSEESRGCRGERPFALTIDWGDLQPLIQYPIW